MESTRQQLLDTAERLFVDRGIDDVSTRTIVREAGQKNQSALQYHFGGREGLVRAILGRRLQQVEEKRRSLMEVSLGPDPALRDLFAVLVTAPFLLCREKRDFREFMAEFAPRILATERQLSPDAEEQQLTSLKAIGRLVAGHLDWLEPEILELRLENIQSLVMMAISRRARLGGSFRGRNADLFLNNLVDQVAAMLAAPVSNATNSVI